MKTTVQHYHYSKNNRKEKYQLIVHCCSSEQLHLYVLSKSKQRSQASLPCRGYSRNFLELLKGQLS